MIKGGLSRETMYAPIIIFCYRRPDHLRKTLQSLIRCDGFDLSPIIVYSDGPKNSEQIKFVEQTREIVKFLLGDRAEYHFRKENIGLSRSVIEGVNNVISRFDRAIVIEDDLELAPEFLNYMNHALECFACDDRIWQVSGYMFDVPQFRTRTQGLFLPMIASWGWATWKRAWHKFDPLATGWEALESESLLRRRFNLYGAYDYATMLRKQMLGQIDSWAIRWYWTVFKANGLTVFPPITLVRNHGFDGSGSHGSGLLRNFTNTEREFPSFVPEMPEDFHEFPRLRKVVFDSISKANGGALGKCVDWIRRLVC